MVEPRDQLEDKVCWGSSLFAHSLSFALAPQSAGYLIDGDAFSGPALLPLTSGVRQIPGELPALSGDTSHLSPLSFSSNGMGHESVGKGKAGWSDCSTCSPAEPALVAAAQRRSHDNTEGVSPGEVPLGVAAPSGTLGQGPLHSAVVAMLTLRAIPTRAAVVVVISMALSLNPF